MRLAVSSPQLQAEWSPIHAPDPTSPCTPVYVHDNWFVMYMATVAYRFFGCKFTAESSSFLQRIPGDVTRNACQFYQSSKVRPYVGVFTGGWQQSTTTATTISARTITPSVATRLTDSSRLRVCLSRWGRCLHNSVVEFAQAVRP